jgi:lipopolysaccharide export system permease protein
VGKKELDGNKIEKVLIYDQTNAIQENTIVAKSGNMKITPDNFYLAFNLQDGTRYQEKGNVGDTSTEYVRLEFKTFKKLFDLSAFQQSKGEENAFRNDYKMLSAKQLNKNLDSIVKLDDSTKKQFAKNIKMSLPYLNDTSKLWSSIKRPLSFTKKDTLLPDSALLVMHDRILAKTNELKNSYTFNTSEKEKAHENILNHKLEWQRKFAFSLACMVLFFIGAPLGSIIRKGGMGMPLVVAIVFFLIFHLLNMFGEKFVKSEMLSPFFGMWLAVILLTPVGIFFTYKAMNDSQLFNKEFYSRLGKKIKAFLPKRKTNSFA